MPEITVRHDGDLVSLDLDERRLVSFGSIVAIAFALRLGRAIHHAEGDTANAMQIHAMLTRADLGGSCSVLDDGGIRIVNDPSEESVAFQMENRTIFNLPYSEAGRLAESITKTACQIIEEKHPELLN